MKNVTKSGFVFAVLLTTNAHADLMQVNLTGTVDYAYAYNNGSSTVNQGDKANLSFVIDTLASPSYTYNYDGSSWGYPLSYTYNQYSNAISSISGNFGNYAFSKNDGTTSAYAYNETYYGTNYSGAGFSNDSYTSTDNQYNYQYSSLSSWSNAPIDIHSLMTALFSSTNPISFYLNSYAYDYNSGMSSYTDLSATFNKVSINPVGASVAAVPVPAAVWLFGSALLGIFGIRKKSVCNTALSD